MSRQAQHIRPKKLVYFFNWTKFDFEYPWDKTPYFFAAGSKTRITDDLAEHFAVHLVEHYINESDTKDKNLRGVRGTKAFQDLVNKCVIPIEGETAQTAGEIKKMEMGMLTSDMTPPVQPNEDFGKSEEQMKKELQAENGIQTKKKAGRPKKVKEEVFEGMN